MRVQWFGELVGEYRYLGVINVLLDYRRLFMYNSINLNEDV